jgi:polysaccharide deacetylase 2 family uncharacterized protein YibQ
MDRRSFLIKSAFYFFSSFSVLNSLPKAFGGGKLNHRHPSRQFPASVALIIDDIGYSVSLARQFLRLGIPVTFSVLPRLSKSGDLAVEMRYKGHEIMLHQPMEPYNTYYDPGPGALYVGFDAGEITRIMRENISAVPYAVGVNNHMGSKFTSSQREIKKALWVVKDNGLFFVDSLTSTRSRAYWTARTLHISTACRNIFLDNVVDESAILMQLYKLEQHALRFGRAIGIGHPFPETARAIGKYLARKNAPDISFVHASRILSA